MKPTFSIITMRHVNHIGSMDESLRSKSNYEGIGLSVSDCPKDWRRICKLGGLPLWDLSKNLSKFADYYSCDQKELITWGIDHGYIESIVVIEADTYDDNDEKCTEIFLTKEQFLDEYDECELADARIITAHKATSSFKTELNNLHFSNINPYQELFFIFILKTHQDLDGIWYNHRNDNHYSAPSGIIFDHKLQEWGVARMCDSF